MGLSAVTVLALPCCILLMVSAGFASAKDLPPRKAEERRAARGCDDLGPGFTKIEGSDTCVKVGGSMRVEGDVTINR